MFAAASERHKMNKYLVGIDIGTSACKAAAFTLDGALAAEATESYETEYPAPGMAQQNPGDWWAAVTRALKSITAVIAPSEIAAVGVDGQSWSAVAVDRDGNALCPTPIWTDTRATRECAQMLEIKPAEKWFETAKNPVQPGYTLPKILWYKNNIPDIYEKTDKILQSNSFIVMRLTGEISQDLSQGYGLQCFDMNKGSWSEEILALLGIDPSLLPSPVPCSAIAGRVTAKAAEETGLKEGTPVAAGGLDAACAALGVGATRPGRTQEQGGQAGGMSICTESSDSDPGLIMSYHVVPGMWLLQGGTTGGGGALRWLRTLISPDISFKEMDTLAESAPEGSDGLVFLPYLAGERSPVWNPAAKGVFFGMTYAHTRAHIIRAVMEGTAFALRHNLETAAKAGAKADVMRAMGGSAASRIWTQIKADVTGSVIEVPSSANATVLGAALLAGEGAGVYSSAADAAEGIVRVDRTHTPDISKREIYDDGYAKYLELYSRLEPMMSKGETL